MLIDYKVADRTWINSLHDLAFSYGSKIENSDKPEKMLAHLKEKGMHR